MSLPLPPGPHTVVVTTCLGCPSYESESWPGHSGQRRTVCRSLNDRIIEVHGRQGGPVTVPIWCPVVLARRVDSGEEVS